MPTRNEIEAQQTIDRCDIAFLAIGASNAMSAMTREQEAFRDGFGYDSVIGELVDLAPMLHDLWLLVSERWDSVWYYEVSEPLGGWYVTLWSQTGTQPTLAEATRMARELVEELLGEPI